MCHLKELRQYFVTRDIGQNEVLALKRRDGHCMLLWSKLCEEDIRLERITPAIHSLHVPFNIKWEVDQVTGLGYAGQEPITRSVIRFLKGHGTHYNFDEGTWRHYRRCGLGTLKLFQVLKPFCDNDKKYNKAVRYLEWCSNPRRSTPVPLSAPLCSPPKRPPFESREGRSTICSRSASSPDQRSAHTAVSSAASSARDDDALPLRVC